MSHVFISYSHKDINHRDDLIAVLDEVGIPYWYDRHIEGGRDWRDEIETALKEASVVVVILTADAMDRHFVTYEWAWAIGNGTPLLPLFFENLPINQIHAPLARHQYIECLNGIPERAIEILKEYQSIPPDTLYLNRLILDSLTRLRVLSCVSLWLYPYTRNHLISHDEFQRLIEETRTEAFELHNNKLNELMVGKAYAFTAKQRRVCRQIIQRTTDLYDALNHLAAETQLYFPDHSDLIRQTTAMLANLDQAVDLLGVTFLPYESLNSYLKAISDNSFHAENFPQVLTSSLASMAIQLAIGVEEGTRVWELIETIKQHRSNSAK